MGILGAKPGNKSKNFRLVHLYRLAGSQVICHNDHRLLGVDSALFHSCKNPYHPFGNIHNVCTSGLKILIIHIGKHFCKSFTGCIGSKLCIHLLVINHKLHCFQVVHILQHHLMHIKNHGLLLAYIGKSLIVQSGKLFLSLLASLMESGLFSFCIAYGFFYQGIFLFLKDIQLTDGHA